MTIEGHMIEADLDDTVLRVRGKNKAARIALAGEDHADEVVVPRSEIERVQFKDAGALVNGNLQVHTTGGRRYQLHFRKKQRDGFRSAMSDLTNPVLTCDDARYGQAGVHDPTARGALAHGG